MELLSALQFCYSFISPLLVLNCDALSLSSFIIELDYSIAQFYMWNLFQYFTRETCIAFFKWFKLLFISKIIYEETFALNTK